MEKDKEKSTPRAFSLTFSLCQAKEWFRDCNFINHAASSCIIVFILEQIKVYFYA